MSNELIKTRRYWENSPICDYEVKEEKFTKAYYDRVDEINLNDNNPFNLDFFHFDEAANLNILDVGCGAGFLVRQYAKSGAKITAIDITDISVKRASKSLQLFGLKGNILQANAEELPFKDNSFDIVTSWGVLHHIPSTEMGVEEVYRVLKPGGLVVVSLYYKNKLLFNPLFFPLLKFCLRLLLRAPKERNGLQYAKTADDFVRMYDGVENPIGRAYTHKDVRKLFQKFKLIRVEQHGVPKRFLKGFEILPRFIHRLVDSIFGICLCIEVRK